MSKSLLGRNQTSFLAATTYSTNPTELLSEKRKRKEKRFNNYYSIGDFFLLQTNREEQNTGWVISAVPLGSAMWCWAKPGSAGNSQLSPEQALTPSKALLSAGVEGHQGGLWMQVEMKLEVAHCGSVLLITAFQEPQGHSITILKVSSNPKYSMIAHSSPLVWSQKGFTTCLQPLQSISAPWLSHALPLRIGSGAFPA